MDGERAYKPTLWLTALTLPCNDLWLGESLIRKGSKVQ